MMQIRKSKDRGWADHGWLKSFHTFSFASYNDPKFMGFRALRVINEDRIDGGSGFASHPHKDMEIISYVVSGALEHKDSMGTKAIIKPGEVQRMSAGTGVVHSEMNAEKEKDSHFFQIWIQPKVKGVPPGYEQKSFENELNTGDLVLVASENGRNGSIKINQDADMYISRPARGQEIEFKPRPQRGVWMQVTRGNLEINGTAVSTGDAVSFENAELIKIKSLENSELILFDLA